VENANEFEFKSGFVAVTGRPNVGKSTLINALLGQKIAAVSPRPQTTRKQQLGIVTRDDAQIIFVDTPGLHFEKHKLGGYMNAEAVLALEEDDVILVIVDISEEPQAEDQLLADTLREVNRPIPIVLGLNKVDLVNAEQRAARTQAYQELIPTAETLAISAVSGENLDVLVARLADLLPEGPPFYPPDQITDSFERDIASDLIREAALLHLKHEVPHGIAVRIDQYTERGEDGAYIEATLFVERDSQKGIVIGKGGSMLKTIGTTARKEIEAMSERKVFLQLRVKVQKNWRNDEGFLRRFDFRGRN
jgi:GTP-binding protein Era